jgi:hypothetical protein
MRNYQNWLSRGNNMPGEYSVLDLTTGTVKKYPFGTTIPAEHDEVIKKVDKL